MAWRLECCRQLERWGCSQQRGAHAVFNNVSGSAEQASTNVPITLGRVDITGNNSFNITGVQGVGLTVQTTGGSAAQINVSGGADNLISLPVTFASDGTLTVTSGSTLEVGYPVTVNRGLSVTTSGTVEFDAGVNVLSGGTLQQFGAIVGSQALVKDGAGLLILSGSNGYSDGTTVTAGTLIITAADALPDGSSLTVGAGGTFIFDPSAAGSPVLNPAAVASVPEPGTLVLLIAGAALFLCSSWFYRPLAAYFGSVTPFHVSVRNGEAGRPTLLAKFGVASSRQANRTATGCGDLVAADNERIAIDDGHGRHEF